MNAWESELHSGLIGATAAPSGIIHQQTHSSGSAVYGVTQRQSGGLDPSSPACVFSVNTLHELHGTLSQSVAGTREKGKS